MRSPLIKLGSVFPILFVWFVSSGLPAVKSKKSHCPHNIFSDVGGWDENSKCLAIWQGRFVETYKNFNKLCSERIEKATTANVMSKWDLLAKANEESSIFLGVRIKSRFCSKKVCFLQLIDANEKSDLILYDEETMEALYSTISSFRIPENVAHLNLSSNGQYCLLLTGNLIKAVSCSTQPLVVDRLICETEELKYCLVTPKKRKFSSLCLCKEPRTESLCSKDGIENKSVEKYAPEKFDGLLIGYCAVLLGITLFFVYVVRKIRKQATGTKIIKEEELYEKRTFNTPDEQNRMRNPISPVSTPRSWECH